MRPITLLNRFHFSNNNQSPVSEGANALKLENEVIKIITQQETMNESIDEVNNQYHEELLKNQEIKNIVEETNNEEEIFFTRSCSVI